MCAYLGQKVASCSVHVWAVSDRNYPVRWLGRVGGKSRFPKEDTRGSGESSESDEGRDESGGRWMARFSTLKVGPPIGAKPTMCQMGLTWKHLGFRKEGNQ